MNFKVFASLVAAGALCATAAQAGESNEVLVTKTGKGSNMQLAFDLVSDGTATSFQFFVNVDGLNEKKSNITKCTVQVPSTHSAGCVVKDGQVRVGAFSTSNAPLPRGIVPVGTVTLSGVSGTPTLTNVEFARADGTAVSKAGRVEAEDSDVRAK